MLSNSSASLRRGVGHDGRDKLAFVDNTAVAHELLGEDSATIADYKVAPHLE